MNDDEVLATARASLAPTREFLDHVRMERPAAALVARARTRRRRQVVTGGLAASAAAAVVLVLGAQSVFGLTGGQAPAGATQARTVAHVVNRVENALTSNRMVYRGISHGNHQLSVSWAYGRRNRFEEFSGKSCGHALPSGDCTNRGGSEPYLAAGTTFVHGKLSDTYVTYFNRRYSLSPLWTPPPSACSAEGAEEMGGPGVATAHWSAFIHATLACGAAQVTGHIRINGTETTRITGKPATVKLSPAYAKVIHETSARTSWTLYVDPTTYLPVRMSSATYMFGGPQASYTSSSVTDVQWLPPTKANIAKASVTIPARFHHWRGLPGNQ
jgi:hypothetical protein